MTIIKLCLQCCMDVYTHDYQSGEKNGVWLVTTEVLFFGEMGLGSIGKMFTWLCCTSVAGGMNRWIGLVVDR